MAFASITYTSASGTTFALTNSDGNAIEYLRQADISVTVNDVLQTLTTNYTFNAAGTAIVLNTAVSGATVLLKRDTSIVDATVDFTAGSTLTADDLNNSDKQNRFALQEFSDIYDALDTGTGDLGDLGGFIDSGETWTSDDAHAPTTGAVDARVDSKISSTLTDDVVAGNAITVSDNTPSSGKITIAVTDAAIDTAELASGAVTSAKIADANVTTAKINNAAVTTAKIADANVTTAKLANDAVTSAKIADGTIIAGDIAGNAVTTAKILDANVTTAKIADANVTTAKIANDAVTQAKMANNSVGTAEILDGNVTSVKLADAELKELATMGTATAQSLADLSSAEVQVLDGATVTTAELNKLDGVTATTTELNVVDGITATTTELNQLDGNTLTNSFTATSTTQYPSSNAISNYVVGLMDNLGGFVAIADEVSFPNTNPDPSDDSGTVVSISDAGGVVVNSSGVSTTGRTAGGATVTINGFPTALRSSTLPAGQGLQVVSTSTLNTYDYHKVLATDADIAQLSDDVNDFFARYRVSANAPTTDLDEGDLWYDTTANKMKVYDTTTSAWKEVQSVGNFFINTLSSSSATGGGSATFNGSAYRFTLSNAGANAQQMLVSVNGVIQKPNSGTSQPSEGFAINNNDIIFAAAPASGASQFIVTIGSTVNIGQPSNNTVDTSELVDGAVTNAKVSSSAAIAGTKISPNFGSQDVITTGSAGIGTLSPSRLLDINNSTHATLALTSGVSGQSSIFFADTDTNIGQISYTHSDNALFFRVNDAERMRINSSGRLLVGTTTEGEGGADDLTLATTGNTGITIRSGATSQGAIYFSDGTSGSAQYDGFITYLQGSTSSTDYMSFGTAANERMRIDSDGDVLIGTTTKYADGGADNLVIGSTSVGEQGITIGSSALSQIRFADAGSNTAGYILYNHSDNALAFGVDSERMRIDSSGKVGIGLSNPGDYHASANSLVTSGGITLANTTQGSIFFADSASGTGEYVGQLNYDHGSNFMQFVVNNGERMKIDSSGRLLAGLTSSSKNARIVAEGNSDNAASSAEVYLQRGTATPPDGSDLASIHFADNTGTTGAVIRGRRDGGTWSGSSKPSSLLFSTCADGGTALALRMMISNDGRVATHMNSTSGLVLGTAGNATNYTIIKGKSSSTGVNTGNDVFYVYGNGNVQNSNNSYGQISDQKLKENIVDANSQWNNIKDVRVRNFNFIEGQTHTQIGVVAQELEAVSPGLIDEAPDRDEDGNDLGTVTKSVKYSVLYMKAVKALQEAMTRIETLETQNASLEARLTILEGAS